MNNSVAEKVKFDIKARFTMIVSYLIRLNVNQDEQEQFPLDIIQLIVNVFLYANAKVLTFSSKFKHESIKLTDDNKCAKGGFATTPYVIVDCEPVMSGIHVWRVQVNIIQF